MSSLVILAAPVSEVSRGKTDRQTDRQTNARENPTPATAVSVVMSVVWQTSGVKYSYLLNKTNAVNNI